MEVESLCSNTTGTCKGKLLLVYEDFAFKGLSLEYKHEFPLDPYNYYDYNRM